MPPGIQTSSVVFSFHPGVLVQDLHHRSLLLLIFNQHAASSANVLDNIDDLAEAGGCTACLSEARETEVGAATVFENDEEFNDEGDGLDLQVYTHLKLASYLRLVMRRNESSITSQYEIRLQHLNLEPPSMQTPSTENKTRTECWGVLTIALVDTCVDGVRLAV
jgi:hypothetical protein